MEDENEILSQLIKDIVAKAQAKTKSKEAKEIFEVIHFYLTAWLKEVKEIDPLFKVRELIGVGSYAEGTKIIEPDEFDFLAVIDDFSKPCLLSIDQDHSNFQDGLVKIKVQNDELKSRCRQIITKEHLHCFQPINFPQAGGKRFGHVFIEALLSYAKKNGLRLGVGSGSPTTLVRKIELPSIHNVSLSFEGVEYRAPNVLIDFKFKDQAISVDLSPAIRYYQIEDCFKVQKCAGPALAELVLSRKSLLLIGTREEAEFRITITEAEVEYIQTVMKDEHKIIYILLKYITKKFTDNVNGFPFTSYMMKTACIHHDVKCDSKNISMKQCFETIIEDLIICAQQNYVVSIIDKDIHVASKFHDSMTTNYRTCILKCMKRLCRCSDIKTVDRFDEILEQSVREEKQKRDQEEEDNDERLMVIRDERERKISKLTDMGFDTDEVKSAMNRALDIPELALAILEKEAEERKCKTSKEEEVNETSQRNFGLPSTSQ